MIVTIGCGHAAPVAPSPGNGSGSAVAPGPDVDSMVTSSVVIAACPDSKRLSSALANREIQELVGPCTKVPGGTAVFAATLLPGGRVELSSASGDPTEGVVPICLLKNVGQLKHKLRLAHACKFDVKLEQRGR